MAGDENDMPEIPTHEELGLDPYVVGVGHRLRDARKERGMTLKEAAARASALAGKAIHFTTLGKIETGVTKSVFRYLDVLQAVYGIEGLEFASKAISSRYPKTVPLFYRSQKHRYDAADEPAGVVTAPAGGSKTRAFLLTDIQVSKLVLDMHSGYVVVDPDDRELVAGRHYLIRRPERDTFVRFSKKRMAFITLSPDHFKDPEYIPLGVEPIEVLGRILFVAARPDDDLNDEFLFALEDGARQRGLSESG